MAHAFRRRGWDVGVVSMLPLEYPGSDTGGVRIATLGLARGTPDPRGLLRLRRILRRWRPDVLHSHMVHANLLARAARPLLDVPVLVSTIHNEDEGAHWRYLAYRLSHRLSDVTTAVSRGAVRAAVRRRAAPEGGVLMVQNGIDTTAYRADARLRAATRASLGLSDRFTWLAVGRLYPPKAYPDMISAFARARARHPASRLLIAGRGPLEELILSRIREASVDRDVVLLGVRADVPALMQAADGFVMSSAWEGLPLVLLEAAASSLPIVATDVGGTRDVVLPGVTGFIVPPRDATSLAGAMDDLMAMPPESRRALGEAGRKRVAETFDLELVANRWEAIYLEQLRARRRA